MQMKFSDLKLVPPLNSAIEKLGYENCTPIQEIVIPHILTGRDVSGLAQTGTGKTAAFVIPLIHRILNHDFQDWKSQNFILILVPTRELAEQVYENIQKLTVDTQLTSVSVYGGTGYEKQKDAFKNHVDFVVATPGRLIDLYKEHFVDLKQVRAIVFDEADRMFDMGFKDDMKFILQRVPRERQFLMFSATLNFDVLNTAYQFGAEPIEIDVSRDQAKAENVKDEIFHVGHDDKPSYLLSLIKKTNPAQAIIFSNFKLNVDRIATFLSSNGIPAMGISSLLSQAQRNRVLELFKAENEKNILVATDVAARGLDIKGVDLVINYELPNDAESYVHRIGRTGRAGSEGKAYSLVCDRDIEALGRIEVYLKNKLNTGWIDDHELIKDFKPFPRESSESSEYHERSERYQRRDRSPRKGPPHDKRRTSFEKKERNAQGNFGGPTNSTYQRKPFSKHNKNEKQEHSKTERSAHLHKTVPRKASDEKSGGHKHRHHQGSHKFQKSHSSAVSSKKSTHLQVPSKAQKPTSLVKKIVGFFKKLQKPESEK